MRWEWGEDRKQKNRIQNHVVFGVTDVKLNTNIQHYMMDKLFGNRSCVNTQAQLLSYSLIFHMLRVIIAFSVHITWKDSHLDKIRKGLVTFQVVMIFFFTQT